MMKNLFLLSGVFVVATGLGYLYLQSERQAAGPPAGEEGSSPIEAEMVPVENDVTMPPAVVATKAKKEDSALQPLTEEAVAPDRKERSDKRSDFDFDRWKSERCQVLDLKTWGKYNPSPYRSYYNGDNKTCVDRWYVNLGPLGVTTLMHDRSWGIFGEVKKAFPKALCDADGELVWNHFEVVQVKPGSPADGVLKPGDRILAMGGEYLQGAQHRMVEKELGNRLVRGLEIHAGELIDRGEGTGELELVVLPAEALNSLSQRDTKWSEWKTLKSGGSDGLKVDFPGPGMLRLSAEGKKPNISGVRMVNAKGVSFELEMKRREGVYGQAIEVPGKDWQLSGAVEWKNSALKIEFRPDPVQPDANLTANLKKVNLKLDKIGSFGSHFDPDSEKVYNYSRMLKQRLLVQQESDGSWRAGGYASESFHTSICGLALMSTGEKELLPAVKKAAYYVAGSTEADKWTYSNGVQMLFLAEYYLYTKDEAILPSLRRVMTDARRFVLSDFTAGHSYMQPGYGGSGYIGGGGALCCGLSVACKTPVATEQDQELLQKMLERVQEIAPAGLVPYGRGGKKKAHTEVKGQGGGCGTGPYFVASLLGAGGERFTEAARERFSAEPFGTAENGHATQTLHFFWSVLSSCLANERGYQGVMDSYLWKFTVLREYDGFINKNNYRVEYHNGDGVIGEPYWRTAAYLILMNVHRHELAMTGKQDYLSNKIAKTPQLFHDHKATKLHMIRNWALVDAHLGQDSPASLKAGLEQLRGLKDDFGLEKALQDFFKQRGPKVARDVMRVASKNGRVPSAQLAELVMGVHFDALCTTNLLANLPREIENDDKAIKEYIKKKKKELDRHGSDGKVDYSVVIKPHSVMQAKGLGESSEVATAMFPLENLKIELADPQRKYFTKVIESNKEGFIKTSCKMAEGDSGTLRLRISYTCAGIDFKYVSDFPIPAKEERNYVPALVRVPVKGSVVEDYYGSYSMGILLSNRVPISCEQRNAPAEYLLEGQIYEFEISPGSEWGHDLRGVKLVGDALRELRYKGPKELLDGDRKTFVPLNTGQSIELELEKKQLIKAVYVELGEGKMPHRIEALVDDEWHVISPRGTSGLRACEVVEAKKIRLVYNGKKGELSELRIIGPEKDYQGKWQDIW